MKKFISLILAILLITLSIITTGAYSPIDPETYVIMYFSKYYQTVDDSSPYYNSCKYLTCKFHWDNSLYYQTEYFLVDYSSKNPIEQPYINRFGENNEYYEYCNKTDRLYGSGLAVFIGVINYSEEGRPDNHNDDFYSIEEIATSYPDIFQMIFERQLTDRIGYFGDSDRDGYVTVLDATAIQRHLAQIEPLEFELVSDIDENGTVDVTDATTLQLQLAHI